MSRDPPRLPLIPLAPPWAPPACEPWLDEAPPAVLPVLPAAPLDEPAAPLEEPDAPLPEPAPMRAFFNTNPPDAPEPAEAPPLCAPVEAPPLWALVVLPVDPLPDAEPLPEALPEPLLDPSARCRHPVAVIVSALCDADEPTPACPPCEPAVGDCAASVPQSAMTPVSVVAHCQ